MRDEVLEKALGTDSSVIPRYDIVKPDGTKVAENVQVVLKNNVLVSGTPLNKQSLLKDDTAAALDLNPTTAVPDDALKAIRNSVSYCPKLKVTVIAGATLYVKNNATGVQKSYAVPSTGVVTVDIWDYGTYKVWGILGGVTTSEATVTIDTTKLYTTEVDFYVTYWKFTVANEVGATIRATHTDGTVISGTVGSNNTCTLALPKTGTWTAVGVYDNCNSNTHTLNVTAAMENTTSNATMSWITVTVNVESGSAVTLVSGGTTRGGVSAGGVYKAWLPFTGTWSITAALNSNVTTSSVSATSYKNYVVALTYFVTYGVRIPLGNSSPTAGEYTDDAVGMPTGYVAWASKKIFSGIKPCVLLNGVVQYYLNKNNLAQKEDGTAATINSTTAGDVMVEVPKIGYRIYADASYLYVKITDRPNDPDYCYLAHSLNSINDCDKIYYGAYLAYEASEKLYSISGATPSMAGTLTNYRTYAQARGTGYQLLSFYPWTLLQCLYLIMYKSLDGQTALGLGCTGNVVTAKLPTGGTNTKGSCWGEATGALQMCFLNIEDFWGNLSQWVEGAYTSNTYTLLTAYKDFNDTGSNYPYSQALGFSELTSGFAVSAQGTNNSGFVCKTIGGSGTTYYCDQQTISTQSCCSVGSSWNNQKLSGGPFFMNLAQKASGNNSYLGARLMYKHRG